MNLRFYFLLRYHIQKPKKVPVFWLIFTTMIVPKLAGKSRYTTLRAISHIYVNIFRFSFANIQPDSLENNRYWIFHMIYYVIHFSFHFDGSKAHISNSEHMRQSIQEWTK